MAERDMVRLHHTFISFLLMMGTCAIPGHCGDPAAVSHRSVSEAAVVPRPPALTDDQLMDEVQRATFRCFWDFAHPVSGLTRESGKDTDKVAVGGSGFGVLSILVGVERGYITRVEGAEHLLKTVTFLRDRADRHHGAWPHWLHGESGRTHAFSPRDDGGDIVETAFMLQGLLSARAYFTGDGETESALRSIITDLWEGVEWDWYARGSQTITWHWSPTHAWEINMGVHGFNEAMMVYILAVASPTHGLSPSAYHDGWAHPGYVDNLKLSWDGYRGGPLFLTHYSHLSLPPYFSDGHIQRAGYATYFDRHREQTLMNRRYCGEQAGRFAHYSENAWGLTASKDPEMGYAVHEPVAHRDNGTIAPTAAIGSIVYTPQESLAAMRYFYEEMGDRIWGEYGFADAYNTRENWVADTWLAIDQGPIVVMIENYRTGLLWDLFMTIPEIQTATRKLGFEFVPQSRH